ncbi:MAG: hypothetical protein IKO07_13790 [Clostridia bacterium]|nr:hypothetical protein [Clostridia bacterium]
MSAGRNKALPEAGAAAVKSRITRYFNECQRQDIPATPAGLALALDMSVAELTGSRLPDPVKKPVERALLRIERETLERALSGKGGAKGVEFVLGQTAQAAPGDALQSLTDEELSSRLAAVAEEIKKALEEKT